MRTRLLLGLCLVASTAAAEETTQLPEIVVSGDAPAVERDPSINRYERDDLEAHGTTSAAESLRNESAANLSTGRRGEQTFTLRGFSQRQVALLIDGAPAYIPYDGQLNLALLPAELIDRIEVVKGPASVLFGPNGLGGAVNIVTRRAGRGSLGRITAQSGLGHSTELTALHALRPSRRFGYTVYGGLRRREATPLSAHFSPTSRENGVLRENSDQRLAHLGASANLALGAHSLTFNGQLVDGTQGVPPGLLEPVARYWRFSVWRTASLGVGHEGRYAQGKLAVDELLYARFFDNQLDSYDDERYLGQTSPRAFSSWYHDRLYGGRVRARYTVDSAPWGSAALRLWLGAQHDRHSETGDTEAAVHRTLLTFAPEAELFFGARWSLLAAAQLDLELGQAGAAGPLVALRFDPTDDLFFRLSAARRTRFPTLRERFSAALGAKTPNPDLGPESAWHLGLDASWDLRPGLRFKLSLYDAEVVDLIDLVALGDGLEQQQNIGRARLLGADLVLQAHPWSWIELRLAYSALHARRLDSPEDRLPHRPAHRLSTALKLTPTRWFTLASSAQVAIHRLSPDPQSGGLEPLDPALLWQVKLTIHPQSWCAIWLQGANLLDVDDVGQLGYPSPGRQLWVGMSLQI